MRTIFKNTKKFFLILFILIVYSAIIPVSVFAQTDYIAYMGGDLDQNTISDYSKLLSIDKYKFFNINDERNYISSISSNDTVLDAVKVTPDTKLNLEIIKNQDSNIDALGYADMLLILGVNEADIKLINNKTETSLSMIIQSYNDIGTKTDANRISIFLNGFDLYNRLETEIQNKDLSSTYKASLIFFNLIKESTGDPDLNLTQQDIVNISLGRENVTVSKGLKNDLTAWVGKFILAGNKWDAFFRDISIYNSNIPGNKDKVTVLYQQLNTATTQQGQGYGVDPIRKASAFVILVLFLLLLAYLIYRKKQKKSTL